jgi:hypothetical protein
LKQSSIVSSSSRLFIRWNLIQYCDRSIGQLLQGAIERRHDDFDGGLRGRILVLMTKALRRRPALARGEGYSDTHAEERESRAGEFHGCSVVVVSLFVLATLLLADCELVDTGSDFLFRGV